MDKIPLRFSLCFGLGSTNKATLWPFYNLRKREARLWLMLSGSVLWGLDLYRDWKPHTAMFKKSEAGLCLVFPRLSFVLNGRTVRFRSMGCRRWRCYSSELSTLHLHLHFCCPTPCQQHGTHSCISAASVPAWCPGLNCWGKGDWVKQKDWVLVLLQCAHL